MHGADPRDTRIAQLEELVAGLIARVDALAAENAALKVENAALKAEVVELKARLGTNSTNSSMPPSSDPPGVERPKKAPTGRKRGAQPGHKRYRRELFPPEQVDETFDCIPKICDFCDALLPDQPDSNPLRRQIVDIPRIRPKVTELRIHACQCECCGRVTRGKAPAHLPRGDFGPRVQAVLALLTGKLGASKRSAQEFLSDVLGVDLCVGSVSKAEAIVSEALAPAVAEAEQHVRQQPAANLDETGWRENKVRAWLWVAAAGLVTVFKVATSRGGQVAKELLGEGFAGIVTTDRWSGYNWLPVELRQLCWAHLKRDFQKMADRGGAGGAIGEALLSETKRMFRWWARTRDGTLPRYRFENRMKKLERRVVGLLRDGEVCPDGKVSGMCREILKLEPALWTFVRVVGLEPTNNRAERDLRRAVLWRKGCFGTDSETGSRYAERILTTTTTLRKQKRHVLDFLVQSIEADLRGETGPSLLPVTELVQAAA